jgi:hypothetical protein
MRQAYDPAYQTRETMPEHNIQIMKQTIKELERRGVSRAALARTSGVHKVLVSRLFNRPPRLDGSPKAISKAYAYKICEGLIIECRRRNIDPTAIENILP